MCKLTVKQLPWTEVPIPFQTMQTSRCVNAQELVMRGLLRLKSRVLYTFVGGGNKQQPRKHVLKTRFSKRCCCCSSNAYREYLVLV